MVFLWIIALIFSLWIIYDGLTQFAFFSFLPTFIPEPYASLICLVGWGVLVLAALVSAIKDGKLFSFWNILYITVLVALLIMEFRSIQGDLVNLWSAIKTAWPL